MYGLPRDLRDSEEAWYTYKTRVPGVPAVGLVESSPSDQLAPSPMQIPEAKRLIYDSAKLACLDALLQELKAGDHRVLVYFQMTRMMDLMEEYLVYRQYKYLRLDGSSKLEDRRDMVIDWQTRSDSLLLRYSHLLTFLQQARYIRLLAQYPCRWSWYQFDSRRHSCILRP